MALLLLSAVKNSPSSLFLASNSTRATAAALLRCTAGSSSPSSRRGYRGGANDAEPRPPSPEEAALLHAARPKADAIFQRHVKLPDPATIPKASWGTDAPVDALSADLDAIRRKRLIYRSKQRGWLEVDLLLGTWASEHVPHLAPWELDDYETFVNLETVDIYNVVTLRTEVPEEARSDVVERIREWARNSPLGRADPGAYERVKEKANLI